MKIKNERVDYMNNKIKICAISLLFGENYEAEDDLVAGYTVANLRKHNYACDMLEIWDQQAEQDFEAIQSADYDIVFWAVPTTSNIPEIVAFSKRIKEKNPKAVNIVMGWDHHSAPIKSREILNSCWPIDIIIQGEGEETAVEIVKRLENHEDLNECKGILFRQENEIVETGERPVILELDELPFPVRETQLRHNYQAARISTARGCLGKCSFCPMSVRRTLPVWRGRSPENIIMEMKEVVEKYHIKHFMFVDPTFEDPGAKGKERIRKLAELIIKEDLDITFLINVRAENWQEEDEELIELLFKAGLESLTVGIESGSQKDLELFHKRASVKDVEQFLKLIKKNNIYPAYGFIMFHPFSTLEDLEENNRFLHKMGLAFMMGAYFIRLKAFPGTLLYEKIKEEGYQVVRDIEQYTLYDYKYQDERIERLALKMQEASDLIQQKPEANYYEVQKLTTFVSRLQRKIMKYQLSEAEEAFAMIEEAVNKTKSQLNDLNYAWFQNCINWIREDGSDQEFNHALNKQIEAVEQIIRRAKETQMIYGKKISKIFRKQGIKL